MAEAVKKTTTATKPAAKPAAAKPVAKPATKPAAKPAPKPATKPAAAKPVAKPAATKAATDLPKEVFDVKVNTQAIFDAIMSERASRRQGTHSTKTRGEVSGGGRKPFRQKGTGNARQGSIRSPQWVGGGIVWGPRPDRNYTLKVNKKVKVLAFRSALTLKAKDGAVFTHDFSMKKPSTKGLLEQVNALGLKKSFKKLIIISDSEVVWKSASNIKTIFATRLANITVESISNADAMIFSSAAMKKFGGKK